MRFVLLAALLLTPSVALGQDMARAIQHFNKSEFPQAAEAFYTVMTKGRDAEARTKSEYYVARSLRQAGYPIAALHFYAEVFEKGPSHPYFIKTAEELMQIAARIKDDSVVPNLLDKGYTRELVGLKSVDLFAINYHIAGVSQRRGNNEEAADFLIAVLDKSPYYPRARYRLGVLAALAAKSKKGGGDQVAKALKLFEEAERSQDKDDWPVRDVATLGIARAHFQAGKLEEAVRIFALKPTATARLAEAWSYFRMGDYKNARKRLSATSQKGQDNLVEPYATEAAWLELIVDASECKLEKADATRKKALERHQPALELLRQQLEMTMKDDPKLLQLLSPGQGVLPPALKLPVKDNVRVGNHFEILRSIDGELKRIAGFGAPFSAKLKEALGKQRAIYEKITASLVRERLKQIRAFMSSWLDAARTIDLDAEENACESKKGPKRSPLRFEIRGDFLPEMISSLDSLSY